MCGLPRTALQSAMSILPLPFAAGAVVPASACRRAPAAARPGRAGGDPSPHAAGPPTVHGHDANLSDGVPRAAVVVQDAVTCGESSLRVPTSAK